MNNMSASSPSYNFEQLGQEMHALMAELFPICRSITGDGFRTSLAILGKHIPLQIHEVPSGTQVFDWTVPKEWNIRDAYIKDAQGNKVVDFQKSNLHILQYSTPIQGRFSLAELKEHLYTIPEYPDWIPYKTSYYSEKWGFCLRQRTLDGLSEGEYEVCIDTSLADGSLTYGEYVLPGELEDEVLISCHSCHPSLCNDNLSGVSLAVFLARLLQDRKRRYTYRFLFIPGTIGSITWLALHQVQAQKIKHGLVVACVGDPGHSTYKRSRQGNAEIDRAVLHVLEHSGEAYGTEDFVPYGYDERQYSSPGFNLAVGCLSRTPHGQFAEYHTSADNLDFVQPPYLADSLHKYLQAIDILENNLTYQNTNPMCEPQLGKRGLYSLMGGRKETRQIEMAMLWVLNFSDGGHSLLDIAEKSGLPFEVINDAAGALISSGLLK
jgi:aminopeptidase-like protein